MGSGTDIHPSEIVRAMGLVFSNSYLYGPRHGVTIQAMDQAFTTISSVFEQTSEVTISLSEDGGLAVNNETTETKNPLSRMFVSRMTDLQLTTFSLKKGLSVDEFIKLIEVMNTKGDAIKAAGGFMAVLAANGIQSAQSKTITYMAVADDQAVVEKDKLKAGSGEMADRIMAFLKGDVDSSDPETARALTDAAGDPNKLADLIMNAAEVRRDKAGPEAGETKEAPVVECLRKTFELLQEDPSSKTQKGKKAAQKTLTLLEKDLTERLRAEGQEGAAQALSAAVEEMQDELEIDSLAGEYMKKREAIDSNEKRILRFIKSKGLDKIEFSDLKDRLLAGGLSSGGWRELLLKSGAMSTGGVSDKHLQTIGRLAMLVDKMHQTVHGDDKESATDAVQQILQEVRSEVESLVNQTEKKMQSIVSDVQADQADDKDGNKPDREKRMPRKKLFELLAEIGQEICQPLSVINASVDMINGGMAGAVTDLQKEMLGLVAESAVRLNSIASKLVEIAGVPETRVPDASVIGTIYKDSKG
jgi:hypothetical protein